MILYGEWMDKYKLTIYSLIISDNLLISFAYINDILSNNIFNIYIIMGIGDWGLGIAQSPIPNPQSPIHLLIIIVIS